ncbi:50S ribosomal protein L27 [Verticillium alfalfae VaMs.102]|uniref:Large ribosomal subunit protein bL27m n=1 Tax=Verticillium alfalfae (strain VaMs.102 / ATCC MYA-4576 / FGSC 10136) TaxID=526221 RepID=C9SNH5_VERA1|nr:50S ribosomal protein L27 [Verticillium alfalfae VaMs.102]EEY20340.1 50S ribosomal protein L27 [Verticillium alfalfae VaMs.102]
MRLFQLQLPIRAVTASLLRPTLSLSVDAAPRIHIDATNALVAGRRYASVKAQGQYKLKPRKTIPKKLGAKRTGDQYVIPGNILYKQRGTIWWPGENCIMGRDHTIHAMATGYVKYYRDPARHPDRKYIGVVYNKDDTLPYPQNAERKRRLNMTAHTIVPRAIEPEISASGIPTQVVRPGAAGPDGKPRGPARMLRLRDDYSYREDNWRVGRLVKLAGVTKRGGGRGGRSSRKARFRSRRWVKERMALGRRKRAEAMEGMEEDEWTMMAQQRAIEEKKKKAKGQQDAKRAKAEKAAKLRAAGMRKSAAKKN